MLKNNINRKLEVNKLLGIDNVTDMCRIDVKNGSLCLNIPRILREKLNLSEEHYLIGICEGNTLILIKNSQLEKMLKPHMLKTRELYARIKEKVIV